MESLKDIAPLVEKNPGNAEELLGLLQKFIDPASQAVSPESRRLRHAVISDGARPRASASRSSAGCQPYLNAFEDKIRRCARPRRTRSSA